MIVDVTFVDGFDESPLPPGIFSGFGWKDFTPFLHSTLVEPCQCERLVQSTVKVRLG